MYSGPMQLNMSAPVVNVNCSGITAQGSPISTPAGGEASSGLSGLGGGFAAILTAIVSGLNNNGMLLDASGQPLDIDEITKGLLAGDDKSGADEALSGMIQQLMLQLQSQNVVQPGVPTCFGSGDVVKDIADVSGVDAASVLLPAGTGDKSSNIDIKLRDSGKDSSGTSSDIGSLVVPGLSAATANGISTAGDNVLAAAASGHFDDERHVPVMSDMINNSEAMPVTTGAGERPSQQSSDNAASIAASSARNAGSAPPVFKSPVAGSRDSVLFNEQDGSAQQFSKGLGLDGLVKDDIIKAVHSSSLIIVKEETEVQALSSGPDSSARGERTTEKIADDSVPPKNAEGTASSVVQAQHAEYRKSEPVAKDAIHVSRLNEISEPIEKAIGAGGKHLVIQLNPPELGKVRITLTMDNGVLKADFRVDNQAVKDLFTTAMPQIKSSLENTGLKTGDFLVDSRRGQSDGREQQANSNNNQQQQRQQKKFGSDFYDFFA